MKHKEIKEYKNRNCDNCLYETNCSIGRKKWLNSEYEKEKVVQSNYDKIIKALNNMSIDEFANTRIFYYDRTGFYYGDFGAEDDRETAIKREIERLKKEAKQ